MTTHTHFALAIAQNRYTCKAYDFTKKINPKTFGVLLECLRLAPSSLNIQPWQFLVADSDNAKERITVAMTGGDIHNIPKVMHASHVIVLCTQTDIDDAHLDKVIRAEAKAGRFISDESQQARKIHCQTYLEHYRRNMAEFDVWAEQQIFIALGQLLITAELLGIQATPIGGFNKDALDDNLNLKDKSLKSSVIVALGYAHTDDPNRTLTKARLDATDVISYL